MHETPKINKILDYFEKLLDKKINFKRKPKRKGEMEITYGSNTNLKNSLKLIILQIFTLD